MKKEKSNNRIIFYAALSIVIVLNPIYIYFTIYNLYYGLQCKTWPSVLGEYIKFDVGSHTESFPYNSRYGTTSSSIDSYKVDVLYTYTIDGIQYENKRVSFPDSIPKGYTKSLLIYYNPNNHNITTLKPGINYSFSDISLLFVVLFFDIMSLSIIGYSKIMNTKK